MLYECFVTFFVAVTLGCHCNPILWGISIIMLFSVPFTSLNKCQLNKSAIYKKSLFYFHICNVDSKHRQPLRRKLHKVPSQFHTPVKALKILSPIWNEKFTLISSTKKIREQKHYVKIINCFISAPKAAITFKQEESREVLKNGGYLTSEAHFYSVSFHNSHTHKILLLSFPLLQVLCESPKLSW